MRSVITLGVGLLVVFCSHVVLPYLYVSGCLTGTIPNSLCSLTDAIDPAIWAILIPFVLACIGYNYVLRMSGPPALANRRLLRWPFSFTTAFSSLWVELYWIFNTFGS